MRLYLDSDVWITLFDKRDARHPIVLELFEKIKEKKHITVVSPLHLKENGGAGWLNNFEKSLMNSKQKEYFPL